MGAARNEVIKRTVGPYGSGAAYETAVLGDGIVVCSNVVPLVRGNDGDEV